MKAAPFSRNRSMKQQAKKANLAELKARFLELQKLRQKVRFAECGRFAGAPDGASLQGSRPNTPQGGGSEAEQQ
jgi:hypothetical protein